MAFGRFGKALCPAQKTPTEVSGKLEDANRRKDLKERRLAGAAAVTPKADVGLDASAGASGAGEFSGGS
jgi:hypothetical protein